MKNRKPVTRGASCFLLIAGLFMGTIFTFGVKYWNEPVTREEAIHTSAIYESYKIQRKRGRVQQMTVRFEDYEQLYIDGTCINDKLLNSINNLTPGIEMSMIVHPNSDTIMELHAGDRVLLEFQDT